MNSVIETTEPVVKLRKYIAATFIAIATTYGIIFLLDIDFPVGLEGYFTRAYYKQFGPLAISIELLLAGAYLFFRHPRANFVLAVFAFSALLDPLLNISGILSTAMPLHASILFMVCAPTAAWIAFSNAFNLERLSILGAAASFGFGVALELFFR